MRTVLAAVLRLLFPSAGKHRAGTVPEPQREPWPSVRTYPLPHTQPLRGEDVRLVRPYLIAHEQAERRRTLVLAADFGIDTDTRLIHGMA